MPRKKFEETVYDPFAAEVERLAATTAASSGGGGAEMLVEAPQAAPEPPKAVPKPTPKVVDLPRPVPPPPPAPSSEPKPSKDNLELLPFGPTKRFKVTADEDEAYEEFILRLRAAARSKVDFSVLSRVLWAVALHAETPLIETLKRSRPPKRPSKNNHMAMAEYENAWVEAAIAAFRRMAPSK